MLLKGGTIFMTTVANSKIRNLYEVSENELVLVSSNNLSAFHVTFPSPIPAKGIALTHLSAIWFQFTKKVMPNHMISIRPEHMPIEFQSSEFNGRCMLVKKLQMLPVTCMVRGYLAGDDWKSYQETGYVCGIKLPECLMESQKLDVPLYTLSVKSANGSYEPITFEQTSKFFGKALALELRTKSIEIYLKCAEYAITKGIIIADTKFKFGLDEKGTLILAGEILTPDNSCFWSATDYTVGKPQKSYDKQFLSNWLSRIGWNATLPVPNLPEDVISATSQIYIDTFENLTGVKFCF